jgi:hypothetical protein
MGSYVARMGEMRNVYNILVEKPEGRRPFQIARRRWEENIRMDLREEVGSVRVGFIWLRTGNSHRLL